MEVKANSVVNIEYKGTLADGSVFDSNQGKEPLSFIFGTGMLIPGLEKEMAGMKVGETKTVSVPAAEAYGPKNPDAIQEIPKSQLPQDAELKVGMQLAAQGPQGTLPVVITEIKEESAVIDFNHPLAGQDLTFDVKILDVREATAEELEHGHSHDGNVHGDEAPQEDAEEPKKE